MSALGDYIHLYKKHYAEHGVTRKSNGSANPNYSMEVINNRIKSNVKPISKQTIAELERRLKLNSYNEQNKVLNEAEKQRQQLIDLCYELLYERSQRTEGARRIHDIAAGGEVWYTNKDGSVTPHDFGGRHAWAASKTHDELQKLNNQADVLYRNIQKLIDKINNTGGGTSQTSQDFFKLVQLFNQYTHLAMDPNTSTMGQIKAALKIYRYKGAAQDISGSFGELLTAACQDLPDDLANEEVKKIITQSITGDRVSKIITDKKLISTGYHIFKTNRDNQNQYYIGTTKDKVDVQININDEKIYANVKTRADMGPKSRPELQQVDLLVVLTFLNSYPGLNNFGNHWLNMHSCRTSNEKIINSNALDEILKKEIAYEALAAGNPFKKDVNSANVFVYINRSLGKVYVKSVQQLLYNVNSIDNRIGGLSQIHSLRFKNKKQPEIWQRINDILTEVHQAKINVAININLASL